MVRRHNIFSNFDRHHDHCVLLAGNGSPELPSSQKNSIQYVSMYDNKVLRKFRGHTDAITEISMSPADDMFLTSSKDRTVRYVSVLVFDPRLTTLTREY